MREPDFESKSTTTLLEICEFKVIVERSGVNSIAIQVKRIKWLSTEIYI